MALFPAFPAWALAPAAGVTAVAAVAGSLVWQASKPLPAAPPALSAAVEAPGPAVPAPAIVAAMPPPQLPVAGLVERPAAPAPKPAPEAAAPQVPLPKTAPPPPVQEAKASPPPPSAKLPEALLPPAVPPAPALPPPSFDIVRVEPSGDVLVAGRGQAGAEIALVEGDQVLGQGTIDQSGQFVLLPPNLKAGSHLLALKMLPKGARPVISTQSIAVSVASKANGGVLVALAEPGQPTQILSDPAPEPPKVAALVPASPFAPEVTIRSVEVEPGGGFFATGQASAGASVRLYLNGSFVASMQAGTNGRWSLKISRGLRPGAYRVRADQMDPNTGVVAARSEVPFDYPADAVPVAQAVPARPLFKEPAGLPVTLAQSTPIDSPDSTIREVDLPQRNAHPAPDFAVLPEAAPPAPAALAEPARQTPALALSSPAALPAAPATVAASPVRPAASSPPPPALAAQTPAADVVIREILTATVVRGDSLWRISRQNFGQGIRYTQIYEANASQIRDPSLIFPGQVLVVPAAP